MNGVAPSVQQVRSRMAQVLGKHPQARVVGLQYPGVWAGPPTFDIRGGTVDVAWCPSSLAVREALADRPSSAPPLLVLTDRPEGELGADVLARMERRQLLRIEPWVVLLDLFKARGLDPRLVEQPWLADALIESAPPDGYPPVTSGWLDAATAWSHLLEAVFGAKGDTLDLTGLLEFTLDSQRLAVFAAVPAHVRAGVTRHLVETVSPAAAAILATASAGRGTDAVPVGIVLDVLLFARARGDSVATEALVRAERLLGGEPVDAIAAAQWAASTQKLIRHRLAVGGVDVVHPLLDRADDVLVSLHAGELAEASDYLPRGLEQRLAAFGRALTQALVRVPAQLSADLSEKLRVVCQHHLVAERKERSRAVEMAGRLVRWLALSEEKPEPDSLLAAARRYADVEGHVDWARTIVASGESVPALEQAYAKLLSRADVLREQANEAFAKLLAGWLRAGSASEALVPVESILERVAAPLAARAPVLLVVVDGMSFAVFAELIEDLRRRGWAELAPGGERLIGVAVIPTVTEFSRTSLLCGRLQSGSQLDEKNGFPQHPALAAASRAGQPPVIFHKVDLTDPATGALSAVVREAIEKTTQRIVGIVVNAVDDHLLKGDQVVPQWTADFVAPLPWLLDAARAAGRVVILTSDHGHIRERGTEYRDRGAVGERHRTDDRPVENGEVLLDGPRVVTASKRVIVPWSEKLRYGMRKNGYHGGATPQEVLVPLSVIVWPTPAADGSRVAALEGWRAIPSHVPDFWDAEPTVRVELPARPTNAAPSRQLELPVAAPAGGSANWIDRLFASKVFQAQAEQVKRGLPQDDGVIRAILTALGHRGDRMTRAALAREIDAPEFRLRGLLTALGRLLNIEGYAVLRIDEASDTVILDRALLERQFPE